MNKKEKIYTIKTKTFRFSRTYEDTITGTLEQLTDYFKRTLKFGHSLESSIKTNPKSIESFLSNLEASLEIRTDYPASVELVEEKERSVYHGI